MSKKRTNEFLPLLLENGRLFLAEDMLFLPVKENEERRGKKLDHFSDQWGLDIG